MFIHKKNFMILKCCFILVIVFELIFRTIVFADDSIPVRVKTGTILEVEFPENIANVTKSVPIESLQIETLTNRMFLLPLRDLDTLVYVVTEDNISYCLRLIMDEGQSASRLKIRKPQAAADDPQSRQVLDTIALIKSLITGVNPEGSVSIETDKYEIFNNGIFRITADKVYQYSGGVKGFVLTFENLTDKPVVIPVENIELPGLLAISVDSQILEAMPETVKAYMVIKEK